MFRTFLDALDFHRTTMRISLENVSELPVDFIRLVFDDSTIEPAQQALSEGDLSVFDTYETEYDLLHRPVFLWNKEEKRSIAPRQMLSLTIQAQGKVGWYVFKAVFYDRPAQNYQQHRRRDSCVILLYSS